jgi:hypothetical protein
MYPGACCRSEGERLLSNWSWRGFIGLSSGQQEPVNWAEIVALALAQAPEVVHVLDRLTFCTLRG